MKIGNTQIGIDAMVMILFGLIIIGGVAITIVKMLMGC